MNPRYPIYVISKGRWERRLTSNALERMHVSYRIVIEPQEFQHYVAVIDPLKILTLPFSNLGQGSTPARNWVWEHAIAEGHARHWILDDNLAGFCRLQQRERIRIDDGVAFRACEDFVDRYENVPMAGMNYRFFGSTGFVQYPCHSPFYLNTRVYS